MYHHHKLLDLMSNIMFLLLYAQNVGVERVAIILHIWEVPVSNTGPKIGYSEVFRGIIWSFRKTLE
jgi:hypothetical protein